MPKFVKMMILFTLATLQSPQSEAGISDWIGRISKLECETISGPKMRQMTIVWDHAKTLVGPDSLMVDGQDFFIFGKPLQITTNGVFRTTRLSKADGQLDFEYPWSISDLKSGSSFQNTATIEGENHLLNCVYTSKYKAFGQAGL